MKPQEKKKEENAVLNTQQQSGYGSSSLPSQDNHHNSSNEQDILTIEIADDIDHEIAELKQSLNKKLNDAVCNGEIYQQDAEYIMKKVDEAVKAIKENPDKITKWEEPIKEVTATINKAYENKMSDKIEGNYRYIRQAAGVIVGTAVAAVLVAPVVLGVIGLLAVSPWALVGVLTFVGICMGPELLFQPRKVLTQFSTLGSVTVRIGAELGGLAGGAIVGAATGSSKARSDFHQSVQKAKMPKEQSQSQSPVNNMFELFNRRMENAKQAAEGASRQAASSEVTRTTSVEHCVSV